MRYHFDRPIGEPTAILGDLRFAIRLLRRSPGFTFIAIITLGLGIGANTSAFSLLNEVLLRPMPYPDSDQLDRIYRATPQNSRGAVSPADYLDLKSEMSGYGQIAAYGLSEMSLSQPGEYGWESDHLVTCSIRLPTATYPGGKEITDFQRLALERLEALPGVASASLSYSMPFFGLAEPRKFLVAGRETPEPGHEPVAVINGVSPHYFETAGTPVLDGVASDVQSIYPDRIPVTPQLYQPMAQEPRPFTEIAVRTAGVAPSTLTDSIRTTMAGLDPDLAVHQLQPAETTIAKARYQWAVLGSMLSLLAALGLGLACLGIYGVIARTMAQRTGEFGIRLALGAQVGDIIGLVLTSGAKLAFMGSAIGLIGAYGICRLIAAFFPGMQTNSVPVLAGVTLLLTGVALVACYMPARYASRISPTEALRAE